MHILYIDPGTGSMLISAVVAMVSVIFFTVKDKIYLLFNNKGKKGVYLNINQCYNLVYYSEGSQYWLTFKSLIEESIRRQIETLYLTSDPNDPGLALKSDCLTCIYIGTGREAYYKLNRLSQILL